MAGQATLTADGNNGLGLSAHITGGIGDPGNGAGTTASPFMVWALIILALLLLVGMGAGLRKVRI